MKKLYTKVLWFLLPILIIWGGVEFFYRTVATNFTEKDEQISTEYKDAEILILGNSHTLFGLNPTYFDRKTYNISNVSQTLYFDELIFNTYLPELPNLKAIILNVSYFSLTEEVNPFGDSWRKYFYKHQMNLDVPIVSKYDISNYSLATARPFKKSVDLICEYLKEGTVVSVYPNGYGKQDATDMVPYKDDIISIIAEKHEDGLLDFTENIQRLEDIIATCKKENIEVFLVEMPMYTPYYNLLKEEKKNKIEATLKQLEANNPNTHYLKLSQDERFVPADLRDADHLTNEGAKKASIIMNKFTEAKLE
jgi:hypothetical protein